MLLFWIISQDHFPSTLQKNLFESQHLNIEKENLIFSNT